MLWVYVIFVTLVSVMFLICACYLSWRHQRRNSQPIRLVGFHVSAFQTAYLILFVPTSYLIWSELWSEERHIWNALIKDSNAPAWFEGAFPYFNLVFSALVILLLFQLFRVYITAEMIENPHLAKLCGYKKPSGPILGPLDQLLRISVIIILSFKLITFNILPELKTLRGMSIFLTVLYLNLVFWDVIIILSKRKNKADLKKIGPWMVFGSSLFGFTTFALLWLAIVAKLDPAVKFILCNVILVFALILFFLMFILSSIAMRKSLYLYFGNSVLGIFIPGSAEVCNPSSNPRTHYCDWNS